MDRVADTHERPTTGTRSSIRVFGGVGVDTPDGPVGVGGVRQQRLFALLVLRHGQVVTIDWLAEHLWSDDDRPDAHATRLRTYVSRLRQALPEDAAGWIETESGGYRLVAPADAVEHLRFARLRALARDARDAGDPLAARRLLDEALALWRGEPFRELDDVDGVRADVEQLRLDRLEMLEERWETELDLGRHTQITGELGSFVAAQPIRERAVRQYALALHRSGRTAEALRALTGFRRTLADETGLDPSPALIEFERSLLDGDPSLDAPEGRPLRGYRLVEEVGAGAFAVVWRATQPSVDRDVAIKQIRSELATRPEFIRRFEAEARLIARVEHPHIVPLIDFWRDPDSAYLVMRWLGGETLARRLDDGPLSVSEVLVLAGEIGGALSAAHGHGVVHRDVKPSNVLFDGAGHAYLTDFGIALGDSDAAGAAAALSPGSPVYASPEQLRGDPVGPAADVFGLGAVLFECLVGSPPPRADGAVRASLDARRHQPFSAAHSRVTAVPPAVVDAIVQATEPDPADRFATVAELVEALRGGAPAGEPVRHETGSAPPQNPYVGLRAFDEGDDDRFFGRDRLVDEIVGRVAGTGVPSRCVVVVGPSGSGKSSLVRAGVVPALRRGAAPGSHRWFTTTMVPGGDAYGALEAALLRIAVDPPQTLLAELGDGDRGILRGVRRCAGEQHVLLVVDQLEELFTAHDAETAERFLTALSVAVDDPSSRLRLIATIRADFYDRPLRHPSFARVVKQAAVEVTPLAADEVVEAITEPARQVGVAFEPGLVATVAADAVGRASPLPLVQYALSELFERRASAHVITGADYEAVGGIAGALTRRAEAIYAEADAAERAAIRSVFGRLTNPDDADTRRRVVVADLGGDEATRRVLDRFGGARLVTFDRDDATREPTVEVAHEALLREWPRAAAWLEEDRELRRTVGAIGAAATLWERGGRQPADLYRSGRLEVAGGVATSHPEWLRAVDHEFIAASQHREWSERAAEQQRIRRLRRLVVGTAAALVVALVAGGVALTQQRRADRAAEAAGAAAANADVQRRTAEDQAALAEAAAAEAELATLVTRARSIAAERPQAGLLLALEARRRSPGEATDRALLDTLAASELGRQVGIVDRLPAGGCGDATRRIGPDGLREFGIDGEELLVHDLVTGEIGSGGPAPAGCVRWVEDAESGRRWAGRLEFEQWTGRASGPWVEADVGRRERLLEDVAVSPGDLSWGGLLHAGAIDGRLLYWHTTPETFGGIDARPVVVDAATLAPVGEVVADLTIDAIAEDGEPVTASSAVDGLFAVAATPTGPDAATQGADEGEFVGPGPVVLTVLDAADGREVVRLRRSTTITAVAFDHEPGAVVVGTEDGEVEIVDLVSGRVVARAAMARTGPVIAVRTRPDGVVVAVGRRSIELFDRGSGRVGVPVDVPVSDVARVRPDGTVVVVPTADPDTIRVVDPTGGPLAEAGRAVDPAATVGFGAGRAGVVPPDGAIEVVDLDSGETVVFQPAPPGGEPCEAVAVVPDDGGLLAWDGSGSIGRWRDGEPVARSDLWTGPGQVDLVREPDGPATRGGERNVGAGAATVFLGGFPQVVHRFDPGTLDPISTIDSPPRAAVAAAPAPDGGVHLVHGDGVVRTYDRAGRSTGQVDTGLANPRSIVADPTTGLVALGGGDGAGLVEPAAGTFEIIDEVQEVTALAFARGGEMVVIVERDGSVRLWDTVRSELVGTLWSGDGTVTPSTPWYDSATDSVWVATSGTIGQLPRDPDRWADRICTLVGRELTPDARARLVPGDAEPQHVCS